MGGGHVSRGQVGGYPFRDIRVRASFTLNTSKTKESILLYFVVKTQPTKNDSHLYTCNDTIIVTLNDKLISLTDSGFVQIQFTETAGPENTKK